MNAETVCLRAAVGYQACGPSCSCSSPPGIGSRSRSCRLWGCKCWRSPSPSMWTCSLPMVEAGTSAEGDEKNCLATKYPVWCADTPVIWPCTFCQEDDKFVTLSTWEAITRQALHITQAIYCIRHRGWITPLLHGEYICTVVAIVGAFLLRSTISSLPLCF